MNREIIKISDIKIDNFTDILFGENIYLDDNKTIVFKFIKKERVYVDLYKQYSEEFVVFERCRDNKFFKIEYIKGRNGIDYYNDLEAIEVFPKQVEITIYE